MTETAGERPVLVLASRSPRRGELLRRAGIPFTIQPADGLDESAFVGTSSAQKICRDLAVAKAEWVWERTDDSLPVLGADTVVALGEGASESVLGKPSDDDHARAILRSLSGRTHRVLSGVAVAESGGTRVAVEVSEVEFRDLSDGDIESYVATRDHEGKAGAYGLQSKGRDLVAGFQGCFYNIVGFPMTTVRDLLPDLLVDWRCDCDQHPLWLGGNRCGERR